MMARSYAEIPAVAALLLVAGIALATFFSGAARKGAILPGSDGDLTIVDMKKETVFQHEDMLSKAGHTSWVGMKATGAAVYGVVRGQVIMKDGKVLSDPGQGRFTPGTAASA